MQSDAELVHAVLDGQGQAFAGLVKRYERPIRAIALDVLGDFHLAGDATQETFIKAYEQLPRLRRPEAFGSWLTKIAYRCALDAVRRRPKEGSLDNDAAAALESPNGQLDQEKQRLLAAVVRLPTAERQVVMLRYFGGHRVRDVSKIVGRSVGTVTKQLSRAHRRLRRMLEV